MYYTDFTDNKLCCIYWDKKLS